MFRCHNYTINRERINFVYSSTDSLVSCLKNNIKMYMTIYIKTAPTYFGVIITPSTGSA